MEEPMEVDQPDESIQIIDRQNKPWDTPIVQEAVKAGKYFFCKM